MKIRSKLLMFTATAALCANMAFAALDTQALADTYIADGYSYVEIKTGPTQTKVEAVNETTKIEVIYDNETGAVIKQESEAVDAEYAGRSGVEIKTVDEDFEDGDDDSNDDDSDDDEDDDEDDDDDDNSGHGGGDDDDDDEDDDSDDDEDDDNSGHGGGDDDDSDDSSDD